VRIGCWIYGVTLPEDVAGNLFLLTSAVAGSLSAYFYVRSLKHSEPNAATTALSGNRD
jgi:hypothetical protein